MANVSRENLKARFRRGMFPTEGDFANVFDSYVHKDDGIDINDVTAENGSKTLTTLLQEFKQEILQDAKDQQEQYDDTELKGKVEANEGNISSLDGRVSTNESDIQTLKDDLDTAEDYIAGHETRIQALEERTEVPEGLAEFIEKVNSFLEDSDATDAAINKWKEIEAFLTGITDTETLTGLLADLKQEILDEIPEQKEYTAGEGIDISEDGVISLKEDENKLESVKVIADLDASTAPTGTVAIYTGESNEKYTHGFIYEKMEGEKVPVNTSVYRYKYQLNFGDGSSETFFTKDSITTKSPDASSGVAMLRGASLGSLEIKAIYVPSSYTPSRTDLPTDGESFFMPYALTSEGKMVPFTVENGVLYVTVDGVRHQVEKYGASMISYIEALSAKGVYLIGRSFGETAYCIECNGRIVNVDNTAIADYGSRQYAVSGETLGTGASWTPLNVMNVIN